MAWWHNSRDNPADGIEDLAYPPTGGRVKQIGLGIILPLAIAGYALHASAIGRTVWFGERETVELTGEAARAMSVCYFAIAAFCHFRWFWGMTPAYRVFVIGIVFSMISGLGGCAAALYYEMR